MTDRARREGDGGAERRVRAVERLRRAAWTAVTATGSQALSILLGFVTLPLVVGYLGPARYGVWVTVVSAAGWLALLDFGLGLSLTNEIARSSAEGDEDASRAALSTALAVSGTIALALLGLLWAGAHGIGWTTAFNAAGDVDEGELRGLVLVAGSAALLGTTANLMPTALRALQRGYVANAAGVVGALLSFGATVLCARARAPLPVLGAALFLPGLVATVLLGVYAAWALPGLRPRLGAVRTGAARGLLRVGAEFLVMQLAFIGTYQADNVIVAQVAGPAAVTPFSIAVRLMATATFVVSAFLSALWPAYTEAGARGDWAWVRRTHRRVTAGAVALGLAAGLGLFALGPWFVRVWAGPAAVGPRALYAVVAAAGVAKAWSDCNSVLLNALGRVRIQTLTALAGAAATIGLAIPLGLRLGTTGVAAAGLLVALALPAWWLPLLVRRTLARVAAPPPPGGPRAG